VPDQLTIYSEGWSEGTTRGSDGIDRLSIALPSYLRRQHIASPSVAHGITSSHRATTLEVTNCDDAGAGSLRDTVASALTHMLRGTSPAIDTGSNNMAVADDQRGTGFPRIFGAGPDMGATEWQGGADAWIFNGGFESICDR
jgi:hypothetical protein